MSIIYDALTKTEKNIQNGRLFLKTSRFTWVDGILIGFIIVLTIVAIGEYYHATKKFHKTSPPIKPIAHVTHTAPVVKIPVEMAYQGSLQLGGVFISEQEKLAFINNQALHVGDTVEGKKIISIGYDKVKLQEGNNIYIIQTKA